MGYARVSTAEQDTALQTDALRNAGCERVFEDTASVCKAVSCSAVDTRA
ncbi:recombinase family protein [Aeromonas caviae]